MKVWAVRVHWTYEIDDVHSLWANREDAIKERQRLTLEETSMFIEYTLKEYEVKEVYGESNTLSSTKES